MKRFSSPKKYLIPVLTLILILTTITLKAQQEIPLYPAGKIPYAQDCQIKETTNGRGGVGGVSSPAIYSFIPQKKDKMHPAIIICPGGGYQWISMTHEGYTFAKVLNKAGIAVFILKYRLPNNCETLPYLAPIADAETAIKYIRQHADSLGINPQRVGIMGFSAGGHLASSLCTHFETAFVPNEGISFRPDFAILAYPVISFRENILHKGSRDALLKDHMNDSLISFFSNDEQVNIKTPQTFLICAADDKTVPPVNSLRYFQALLKANVPTELHVYRKGGHGFGLVDKAITDRWIFRALHWLKESGFIEGNLLNAKLEFYTPKEKWDAFQ